MKAEELAKLEAVERLKTDEMIQRTQIRKKILKEKIIGWIRRHPIAMGITVVLIAIQFVNAYYKMDRMDRKLEAKTNQEMWRRASETR